MPARGKPARDRLGKLCGALPPRPHTSASTALTPARMQYCCTALSGYRRQKRFIATATGREYTFVRFSICLPRFSRPAASARGSGGQAPPWAPAMGLRARTVATSTQHREEAAQTAFLYQEIFSAPRSAPKPACYAVVRRRRAWSVAIMLLQPGDVGKAGPP